jgi:tRNA pseudouridine55 synthase
VTRPPGRSAGERPRWRDVDGIVLLDKPTGLGSTPALQRVRRLLRAAKAGHAGTLDPIATGMLPLCFGQATKACGQLLGSGKAYRARVTLGAATDTGDADGAVIRSAPVPVVDRAELERTLATLVGSRDQVPPMYSALKHAGRPLYEMARRGEEIARAPRRITIHRIELQDFDAVSLQFDVVCSKGTYIRVLGEELATALGTAGHLSALRRLWVEPFEDRAMVTLEAVEAWVADHPGEAERPAWLLPVDAAFATLPRIDLDARSSLHLRQGRELPASAPASLAAGELALAYDPASRFLGLVTCGSAGQIRVERLFVPGAAGEDAETA